jgi:hypothetical protein
VLAPLALAAPGAIDAQKLGRLPQIGYVFLSAPECVPAPGAAAFPRGLRELEYVVGRDVILHSRCYRMDDELRKILDESHTAPIASICTAAPPGSSTGSSGGVARRASHRSSRRSTRSC